MQMRPLELILTSLLFIAFAVFLLASNSFDWGYFYSTGEVDLRSWLIDGRAPLWSYQLCAGSSRLGDPQAFGLSPLFLPVLLAGPILGFKIMIWLFAILGFFALRATGLLVAKAFGREPDPSLIGFLALTTIFSNYFLWHLHVGHVSFALMYGVFVFVYFFLKACCEELKPLHALGLALLSFAYFSAGFSGSLIYLLLPVSISLLPVLVYGFNKNTLKPQLISIARFTVAMGLGILAASYKVFGVANYQALFPRTLDADTGVFSFSDFLLAQFIPTFHSRFLLGSAPEDWGIWEYSAFNLTALFLVALSIYLAFHWRRQKDLFAFPKSPEAKYILVWMLGLFALGLSILSPSDQPLSLVYWINVLLHNSVRVFSRFQVIWILLIYIAAVLVFSLVTWPAKIRRALWLLFIPLLALNFFSFKSLSLNDFKRAMQAKAERPAEMKELYWAANHPLAVTVMYPAIISGLIVPNCYQPMNRKLELLRALEPEFKANPEQRVFPLVAETENPACRANSSVSQNEVHLDPSCPVGTCLNLNDVNLYDPPERLAFKADKNRWCVEN